MSCVCLQQDEEEKKVAAREEQADEDEASNLYVKSSRANGATTADSGPESQVQVEAKVAETDRRPTRETDSRVEAKMAQVERRAKAIAQAKEEKQVAVREEAANSAEAAAQQAESNVAAAVSKMAAASGDEAAVGETGEVCMCTPTCRVGWAGLGGEAERREEDSWVQTSLCMPDQVEMWLLLRRSSKGPCRWSRPQLRMQTTPSKFSSSRHPTMTSPPPLSACTSKRSLKMLLCLTRLADVLASLLLSLLSPLRLIARDFHRQHNVI
jgi:hypothetical protein